MRTLSENSVSTAPGAFARDQRAEKVVLLDRRRTNPQSASETIRVLIACGNRLVRAGLNALLNREADIVVVGAAANGRRARNLARQLRPDVLLIETGPGAIDGMAVHETELAELAHGIQAVATARPFPHHDWSAR